MTILMSNKMSHSLIYRGVHFQSIEIFFTKIMDSSSETGSDSDYFDDANSGSETGDGESRTSDDDDEIDLENLKLDDDSTWKSSYTSSSGMIWSSTPYHSTKNDFSNDVIQKAGLTNTSENISSVEDAFMCFMPNKLLEKILDYSNLEYTHKNTSKKKNWRNNNHRIEGIYRTFITCWFIGEIEDRSEMLMEKKSIRIANIQSRYVKNSFSGYYFLFEIWRQKNKGRKKTNR